MTACCTAVVLRWTVSCFFSSSFHFLNCVLGLQPAARQPGRPVQPHELGAAGVGGEPGGPYCHVPLFSDAPGPPTAGRLHGGSSGPASPRPSVLHPCPSARQPAGPAAAGLHTTAHAAGMDTLHQWFTTLGLEMILGGLVRRDTNT